MSFRNNTEAENYRLKAELEEKEKALKEATAKLNKLERDDELDELEKKLVKEPSWFARKLEEREQSKRLKEQAKFQERLRKAGTYRSSYGRRSRPFDWEGWGAVLFTGLVAFFIIFAICHSIYHYFYDFQSGTVVERERIPAHMNCSDLLDMSTDEENFGCTYDELAYFQDCVVNSGEINAFLQKKFKKLCDLHKRNAHKYQGQTYNPFFIK